MLQVFYLDVAYVAIAIHICCKHIFQMFHLFQMYVAARLHVASVFISRCNMFYVFQMYVSYVSSECSMYFIWMLQI
jgi:hypothetical protein